MKAFSHVFIIRLRWTGETAAAEDSVLLELPLDALAACLAEHPRLVCNLVRVAQLTPRRRIQLRHATTPPVRRGPRRRRVSHGRRSQSRLPVYMDGQT